MRKCIICDKKIFDSSTFCRECYLQHTKDWWLISHKHYKEEI